MIHGRPAKESKPVIPPSRGGEGRRRPRRPARGLSLTCTRPPVSRSHRNLPNLAVELWDVGWGGIRFLSVEPLQHPCPLVLQIKDLVSGEVFHARGEVAWSETRRLDNRETHVVGARFDEILTAPSKCARFFEDLVAPGSGAAPSTLPDPELLRRTTDRFPVDACRVTVHREESGFRMFGKPQNIASQLHDLSRTGAQVSFTDPVKRGEKVRLSIYLEKFKDTLEADAVAVWTRFPAPHEGNSWRVGLEFRGLDRAQKRLLESMEGWFKFATAPERRTTFRPLEKPRPPLA